MFSYLFDYLAILLEFIEKAIVLTVNKDLILITIIINNSNSNSNNNNNNNSNNRLSEEELLFISI